MDYFFTPTIENIPGVDAKVVFSCDTTSLFKEDADTPFLRIDEHTEIVPWGANNLMPYDSIYFEDVVKPFFSNTDILRDFTPYRSTCYSLPLTGTDDANIEFLTSITILLKDAIEIKEML